MNPFSALVFLAALSASPAPSPSPAVSTSPAPATSPVLADPFASLPILGQGSYRDVLQSPQYLDGHGWVVFVYQTQHDFIVPCSPDRECEIRFASGDSFQANTPKLPPTGNGTPWSLRAENVTVNGVDTPTLFVEPFATSRTLYIPVDTDHHTYNLQLVPQASVSTWRYRFAYPDAHGVTTIPVPTPAILATPTPAPAPATVVAGGHYAITGAAPFYPIAVALVNDTVRITLPSANDVPSVGTFSPDHPNEIDGVNWTMDSDDPRVLVVLDVVSPLVLYENTRHGLLRVVLTEQ